MHKIELLSPAGDLERLKVAFAYGADAVYMGGHALSLRAKAKNFAMDDMATGIAHAHSLGKKVYITVNAFARNDDFTRMDEYLLALADMQADALIISDPGVFATARRVVPHMEIHISTQANVTNYASVAFWRDMGASRVILARELSLNEIAEIAQRTSGIGLEAFVHGAMCMSYSGRCLISNYLNGRDANRGDCCQPCRSRYALVEERGGEVFPVHEDEEGSYIMNAKDLCMVRHIPELVQAGVTSFKIEGRMKTAYYVGAATQTYRHAMDDYFTDPALYESKRDYYQTQLEKVSHRHYTTGFYLGNVTGDAHNYHGDVHAHSQEFLGLVESYDESTGRCVFTQRNKFSVGDTIEIIRAGGAGFTQVVTHMYNENGAEITSAPHPQQIIQLKVDAPVAQYDLVRKSI